MKPRHLNWLLIATALMCFIPWEAKQHYPGIFGSPYIQWVSSVISAILLSVGMFLSIRCFFSFPEQRRKTVWTCMGFIFLFTLILGILGLTGSMLSLVNSSVDTLSVKDSVPVLMQELQNASSEDARKVIAKTIYIFSGFSLPYQMDDGSYTTYKPTESDINDWVQTKEVIAMRGEIQRMLNSQIKQLSWLISLYLCSFCLTFFVGFLTLTYKMKK